MLRNFPSPLTSLALEIIQKIQRTGRSSIVKRFSFVSLPEQGLFFLFGLIFALSLAGCGTESPHTSLDQRPAIQQFWQLRHTPLGYFYVANSGHETVTLLDVATAQTSNDISMGLPPTELPLPGLTKVPVSPLPGPTATLGVMSDTENFTLGSMQFGEIKMSDEPTFLDASPDKKTLWTVLPKSDLVEVVEADSHNRLAQIKVGRLPYAVHLSPDGKLAYVTSTQDNLLVVIDTKTFKVINRINVGHNPNGFTLSKNQPIAYVANKDDNSLSLVNLSSGSTTTVPIGAQPMEVLLSSDQHTLFISLSGSESIAQLDIASRQQIHSPIKVGRSPTQMVQSLDGRKLYVANSSDNLISVIDQKTQRVETSISVGQVSDNADVSRLTAPTGLAITQGDANNAPLLAVTCYLSDELDLIDTSNNRVIQHVSIGTRPIGIIYLPGDPPAQPTQIRK